MLRTEFTGDRQHPGSGSPVPAAAAVRRRRRMALSQSEQRRLVRVHGDAQLPRRHDDGRAAAKPGLGGHVDVRGRTLLRRDGCGRDRQRLLAGARHLAAHDDRPGGKREPMMRRIALIALLVSTSAFAANDCDISVQPAATLLLPYFEVDLQGGTVQTLFTVQNVSPLPQIAHVTLWTDWGYPVLGFPVFLTGYDVQGINLYDVLAKGLIAPPNGTSSATPVPVSFVPGGQPAQNDANLNFLPGAAAACAQLPGRIAPSLLADLQAVYTRAKPVDEQLGCASTQLGNPHGFAIGYATIDVVATCTTSTASSPAYLSGVLLYDNVLTGDYQIVRANDGYAEGGPLVHMRAVPEGGMAGTLIAGALPYTFYDRYTKFDQRQPLSPGGAFAPRPSQNWVTVTMVAAPAYATTATAAAVRTACAPTP